MTTHQLKWREVTGQNLDHVAVDQRRGQTEKRELVEHAGE
jgi:hypothetical protein